MRLLLLPLFTIAGLFAQTTAVKPDQVKTASSPAAYRVLAFDSAGKVLILTLGSGFSVSGSVISVTPATPSISVSFNSTELTPDGAGTYPAGDSATVYTRNGLLLLEGKDYNLSGGRLVPIGGTWAADDLVVARKVSVTF